MAKDCRLQEEQWLHFLIPGRNCDHLRQLGRVMTHGLALGRVVGKGHQGEEGRVATDGRAR
eukprot:4093429-Alexandrium_andersonii.AAC.1